jgi:hypothetical protein
VRATIDAGDLIDAAEAFLRDIEGELSDRSAFHAKVAANALAIAAREFRQKPAEAEAEALAELLPDTPPDERRRRVAGKIRAGEWSAVTPGLLDAVEKGVIAHVTVDNPKFSTLARLKGKGPA